MRFTFPPLRIISTVALSVNKGPQQEAAKTFYFTAAAAIRAPCPH